MDGGCGDLRSTIKKWNVIYPVYLNSKKTVAEGRRIAAAKACPDPTCIEIADCCSHLKIPHAVELDKAYPRDFFQVGRVRVQLKKDDGSPVNPAIKTTMCTIPVIHSFSSSSRTLVIGFSMAPLSCSPSV
ncbi:signal recognition particle 19 kDa protein isoform X1 [Miscanthus floridulus]|uniref:signal recognition particle 19 kDa protein isoform X1 n=1 Tax=Miscanthus floridulus TaxID=154761 RepID=UPI00345B1091